MPTDDETASPDPLEDLLADWFAGAMLAAHPPPSVEDESAYAAELERLAATRVRARALAHAQCVRLYTQLEGRASPRRIPRPPTRRARFAAPAIALAGCPRFELSI